LAAFVVIYAGRAALVLRAAEGGGLRLDTMTWGFPGPQAAGGRPVTNVRNLSSPFWRSALKEPARRCIVPVTRFCEWTQAPNPATGRKSKIWFGLHEDAHPLFAFAGLWRPGGTDGEGPFMAFLTCDANQTVGQHHPKAMPVMLRPGNDIARWLGAEQVDACALAVPFADTDMRVLS
jgi:putative SOS response-associated peptidase YedK